MLIEKQNKAPFVNLIYTIRGHQVMLDTDLASIYGVQTKRLNEQVKRNIERFPETFRFQLTDEEKNELVANCDRLENLKHSSVNPNAFTEQGVAMLTAVLKSETAVKASIQIINAFVEMRKVLYNKSGLLQRMDRMELKLAAHDEKLESVFRSLEANTQPRQGIFFDGQVFDAYAFACNLIKNAQSEMVLIDNYIDESVLTLLTKRKKNVAATIYTQKINAKLKLDIEKHNSQYPEIEVKTLNKSHDRFLLIDGNELYHMGASLKDLGKKWFAFSRMDDFASLVMERIKGGK